MGFGLGKGRPGEWRDGAMGWLGSLTNGIEGIWQVVSVACL